jgi:hypothetical protein
MFDFLPKKPIPPEEDAEISKKIWTSIKALHQPRPLPPILYHYTGAAGLKGIVESGVLRATHIAFMNDASEYLHAVTLLLESIKAALKSTSDPLQIKLLEEIEPSVGLTRPQDVAPYFVACFSAQENSLNQWRAYGGGEGGFCIGFDTASIDQKSSEQFFFLSPAIYDRDEQAKWVHDFLHWALLEYVRVAQRHQSELDEHRRAWAHMLLWRATAAAPIMKNPAFAEEQEWRLIHVLQSKWDVRFLPKPVGLTPYVELKLGAPQTVDAPDQVKRLGRSLPNKLPIHSLQSGPGRATDISLLAGRTLLEQYNYDGVPFASSKIPYRVG